MPPELEKFILYFLKDTRLSHQDVSFQALRGDGSKRAFWRITLADQKSCFIAMANTPVDIASRSENFAYLMIGTHLRRKRVPVPEIYRYDLEHGWFIMEDMGSASLQDLVSSVENPLPIYEKVLEHLFRLQIEGAKDFDSAWCCQAERYDRKVMRRYEADYFRDSFLCKYLGLKEEWPELESPFNHLAETASRADSSFFLHRDFQSRNILISKGNIGIIDWQAGRLGPLGYDVASLVIDPYTELTQKQRNEVYQSYLRLINKHDLAWIESFKRFFPYLAIQRNLQILGAFSFLTRVQNKPYFEAYIPAALKTLDELLHQVSDPELSPLRGLVSDLKLPKKSLDTPGSEV